MKLAVEVINQSEQQQRQQHSSSSSSSSSSSTSAVPKQQHSYSKLEHAHTARVSRSIRELRTYVQQSVFTCLQKSFMKFAAVQSYVALFFYLLMIVFDTLHFFEGKKKHDV